MQNAKEEILSKLYALRAGMSYLVVKKEELEELQKEAETYDSLREERKAEEICKFEASVQMPKETYKNTQEYKGYLRYKAAKEYLNSTKGSIVPWKADINAVPLIFKILLTVLVGVLILAVGALALLVGGLFVRTIVTNTMPLDPYVQFFHPNDWEAKLQELKTLNEMSCLFQPLCFAGIGSLVYPLCNLFGIVFAWMKKEAGDIASEGSRVKRHNAAIPEIKRKRQEAEETMARESVNVTIALELMKAHKEAMEAAQEELEDKEEDIELAVDAEIDEMENETQEEIKNTATEIKEFFDVLQETFGGEIDIRDWKNIDAIIYYLETHRANDLRDALLSVDQDKRLEDFAKILSEATQAVQRTIVSCTKVATKMLGEGLSMLSEQMEENSRLMQAQNSRIESLSRQALVQQKANARALQEAAERNELAQQENQRLLKSAMEQKANVSSAALYDAIDYQMYRKRVPY